MSLKLFIQLTFIVPAVIGTLGLAPMLLDKREKRRSRLAMAALLVVVLLYVISMVHIVQDTEMMW